MVDLKLKRMKLKVINSNSKGNAYIFENDSQALLLECGVHFDKIKEAIEHKLNKIDLCLCTHEHGDHSKAFRSIQQSGIPVISSRGTYDALKIKPDTDRFIVESTDVRTVKDWKIYAFSIDHDAAEPLGFIIEHPELGKVLFVTDTYILRYNFNAFDFDTIMIEANYCEELAEKWRQGKGTGVVEKRRLKNHMSFQTALKTIERLDRSNCKQIMLLHLSDGLTDEKRFADECEKRFGIPTYCAAPGLEINLTGF
jgi:phosphoribosyl 1,2-cyclic phosphodiesterase